MTTESRKSEMCYFGSSPARSTIEQHQALHNLHEVSVLRSSTVISDDIIGSQVIKEDAITTSMRGLYARHLAIQCIVSSHSRAVMVHSTISDYLL